jgi:hypothetical protein
MRNSPWSCRDVRPYPPKLPPPPAFTLVLIFMDVLLGNENVEFALVLP